MRWTVLPALTLVAFTSPLAAQQRTPINGGLPFVSPDGKSIAFASNRDGEDAVYLIREDGTDLTRLVTTTGMGRWSADGSRVLISRGGRDSTTLFSVTLSGSGQQPIAKAPGHEILILPDGKHMLVGAGSYMSTRLTIMGLDGSNPKEITDGSAGIFNSALSPDKQWVAYSRLDATRAMSVWVMKLDGTEGRAITDFPPADGRPQWPTWSPDGKLIAVQSGIYDQKNPSANTAHIWTIDVATGAARKLAAHDRPYLDETPSFFPDGKHIAFQSDRTGRMEIWVMNADGTGARQVTK